MLLGGYRGDYRVSCRFPAPGTCFWPNSCWVRALTPIISSFRPGAILAVTLIYWRRLVGLVTGWGDPVNRDYLLKAADRLWHHRRAGAGGQKLGFELPETVTPIAWALVIGGIWMIWARKRRRQTARQHRPSPGEWRLPWASPRSSPACSPGHLAFGGDDLCGPAAGHLEPRGGDGIRLSGRHPHHVCRQRLCAALKEFERRRRDRGLDRHGHRLCRLDGRPPLSR